MNKILIKKIVKDKFFVFLVSILVLISIILASATREGGGSIYLMQKYILIDMSFINIICLISMPIIVIFQNIRLLNDKTNHLGIFEMIRLGRKKTYIACVFQIITLTTCVVIMCVAVDFFVASFENVIIFSQSYYRVIVKYYLYLFTLLCFATDVFLLLKSTSISFLVSLLLVCSTVFIEIKKVSIGIYLGLIIILLV